MGTTSREASFLCCQRAVCCHSIALRLLSGVLRACRTMRELGSVFQLRRTPSVSSIWLHWSLRASKSAMLMLGGRCAAAAVVFGQCLVEGNAGAHNSMARVGGAREGDCGLGVAIEQLTAWPQQGQAATVPLDCKVYSIVLYRTELSRSLMLLPIWQLRSSQHSEPCPLRA